MEQDKRGSILGDEKLRSILIVDDDIGIRESFKMILSKDYRIILASNAEEAFLQIKEHSPEIILLDVILPDLDSLTMLQRIKQNNSDIIVIMITAAKTVEMVVEAMKFGAFDYVIKPFDIDEFDVDKLRLIITRSLSKKALEQEGKYRHEEMEKNYNFGNKFWGQA